MYSCLTLGRYGRFGNQMFQYSALFSLAKNNSCAFFIPSEEEGKYELLEAFPNLSAKIEKFSNITPYINKRYQERSFVFDLSFYQTPKYADVSGYFQSEMYFSNCRDEIISEFKFSEKFLIPSSKKVSEIRNSGTLCSLHIRRGDYLKLPDYHTNLDQSFYKAAINTILEADRNVKFLVFSDDLEWCKNNLQNENFIFSNGENQFEDMCMMSLCDYHIIANSSFSWWGSYLSDSKLTIAPKKWFGPRGPQDWSTIYRKDWITL